MSKNIIISAPGKCILFGEHAVVYGKAALATSISLRSYLYLTDTIPSPSPLSQTSTSTSLSPTQNSEPNDPPHVHLSLPDINVNIYWSHSQLDTLRSRLNDAEINLCTVESATQQLASELGTTKASVDARVIELLEEWLENQDHGEMRNDFVPKQNGSPDAASDAHQVNSKKQAILSFLYLYLCIACSSNPHSMSQSNTNGSVGRLIALSTTFPSISVTVRASIPVGAGLGSSASLSVCVAAGLLAHSGSISFSNIHIPSGKHEVKSADLINYFAFLSEKIIHGNPSGVDNSVATYGGAILYTKGHLTQLPKFGSLRFLLTNTLIPKNTKTQVEKVMLLREKFPDIVNPILDSIHHISMAASTLLTDSKVSSQLQSSIPSLIQLNQALLSSLTVSNFEIDELVNTLATYSIATKLTGAGGGGCLLSFLSQDKSHQEIESVIQLIRRKGYEVYNASLGCPGVGWHSIGQKMDECTRDQPLTVNQFLEATKEDLDALVGRVEGVWC
ncbi:GHMP kinase [Paraphysoderma sedebokerense]|nr:GHMP kinase [Paraphysoderma sedebokerense]